MSALWIGGGFGSLALAGLGVVLPVVPTVPFVLLAAACFARGSKRWHRWLRTHRRFGSFVREWEDHRAISTRAKRAAVVTIVLVGGASVVLTPRWEWRIGLAVLLVSVIVYIASRPTPPEDPATRHRRSR